MKLPIIQAEDYLIIVNDEKVKENDCALLSGYAGIVIVGSIDDMAYSTIHRNWVGLNCDTCFDVASIDDFKKITAHLPLNNAPVLKSINLLPELKDELDVLAYSYIYDTDQPNIVIDRNHPSYNIHRAYKNGYKAATKKYTEEDLMRAMNEVRHDYETNRVDIRHNNEIVQSLNKPKYPKYFIPATNFIVIGYTGTHNIFKEEIMSTTDTKGQTTLKGTYSYE